ncbi:cupin domain-containing protein [Qipengyuania sp. ASV99]|uniref:cupin domain-containing protein n=1 Tax=Qipengyuania sp. ASV99 TaxID=3399681 RepID=UPI003A4C7C6B
MPDHTSNPIDADKQPWMPLSDGISTRPLRFAGDERTQLLKVAPGISVGLHSHGGFVHAYNVSGSRKLGTGEIAGPGCYVFEPSGNRDCWECVDEEPVVIFIHMSGALTSLDESGRATGSMTTEDLRRRYLAWCDQEGIEPVALGAV